MRSEVYNFAGCASHSLQLYDGIRCECYNRDSYSDFLLSSHGYLPHPVSERFASLREVTLELTRTFELEPFLQKVVAAVCQGTGSESSSISLYEGETGLLKFVAAPGAQAEQLKLIRVPLENSVAGECYATAEAIVIQDAAQDPRIYRAVDNDLDFVTRSLVAVPILLDKEPIGVLEALNKSGDPYDDADLELLEALASLAAIAILNTRLMEDVRRYYQEVTELEKMKSDFIAVSSHELRTPLGIIIGHASELREFLPGGRPGRRAGGHPQECPKDARDPG